MAVDLDAYSWDDIVNIIEKDESFKGLKLIADDYRRMFYSKNSEPVLVYHYLKFSALLGLIPEDTVEWYLAWYNDKFGVDPRVIPERAPLPIPPEAPMMVEDE